MTTRQLAIIALIFIVYFASIIIVLHFLRPDVNAFGSPTSEYAVGRYSILMSTAFVSMSIATFSLLFGFNKVIYKSTPFRIGRILFAIWGVGLFVALSFPINPEGTEITTKNLIHRINGPVIFLCVSVAAILFAVSFKRDKNWQSISVAALTLSLLMLGLFVTIGISVSNNVGIEGLFQRIFLAVLVSWFILTSLHLRSLH